MIYIILLAVIVIALGVAWWIHCPDNLRADCCCNLGLDDNEQPPVRIPEFLKERDEK